MKKHKPMVPGCHQIEFIRAYLEEAIKEVSYITDDWDTDMQLEIRKETYEEILAAINDTFTKE